MTYACLKILLVGEMINKEFFGRISAIGTYLIRLHICDEERFYTSIFTVIPLLIIKRSLCGLVANVLGCGILVCEFELQLRYYVHFQIKALVQGMNS